MSNAMAVRPPSAVDPAISEAMDVYSRLNALRATIAPDLNDAELQLFAMVAHRSGLDPFNREIHAVKRQGKVTFQTGIDGFRSRAEDTGEYRGSDEAEYGPVVEKPFPHPEWARVVVHRRLPDGSSFAQSSGRIKFDEFYPGDGPNGFQWRKMPEVMLAKCAEAQAMRKAFPRKLSGIYVTEEMQQADAAAAATPIAATVTTHRDRIAAQRASLTTSAAAAEPTADPRPVQADTTETGPSDPAAADPSPVAVATGAGEGDADIVDGQAVEVAATAAGVTAGELRDWLREQRITITVAREVCMRLFRVDSFDALTDEQRGHLVLELDAGARS